MYGVVLIPTLHLWYVCFYYYLLLLQYVHTCFYLICLFELILNIHDMFQLRLLVLKEIKVILWNNVKFPNGVNFGKEFCTSTRASRSQDECSCELLFSWCLIYFPASEHSLVLKEIEVPLWNNDNCNGALQGQFGPAYNLPSTTLCAGAEGRDACDVSEFWILHQYLSALFFYLPELPKRPKQKISCSKMWLIDHLYVELGDKPYIKEWRDFAEMCFKSAWWNTRRAD